MLRIRYNYIFLYFIHVCMKCTKLTITDTQTQEHLAACSLRWARMRPGHPNKHRFCSKTKTKLKRNPRTSRTFDVFGGIILISVWDSSHFASHPMGNHLCWEDSSIPGGVPIEKPIWNCCILKRYHEIWHSLRTQQQKKTQYKLHQKKQAFHSSLRCHCKRKIFEVRIVAPQNELNEFSPTKAGCASSKKKPSFPWFHMVVAKVCFF